MMLPALFLFASLFGDFANPPAESRPWCYWYWVNGNVDRETVVADLEAMKRVGFGGVLMLDPRGYDRCVWKPEPRPIPCRRPIGSSCSDGAAAASGASW